MTMSINPFIRSPWKGAFNNPIFHQLLHCIPIIGKIKNLSNKIESEGLFLYDPMPREGVQARVDYLHQREYQLLDQQRNLRYEILGQIIQTIVFATVFALLLNPSPLLALTAGVAALFAAKQMHNAMVDYNKTSEKLAEIRERLELYQRVKIDQLMDVDGKIPANFYEFAANSKDYNPYAYPSLKGEISQLRPYVPSPIEMLPTEPDLPSPPANPEIRSPVFPEAPITEEDKELFAKAMKNDIKWEEEAEGLTPGSPEYLNVIREWKKEPKLVIYPEVEKGIFKISNSRRKKRTPSLKAANMAIENGSIGCRISAIKLQDKANETNKGYL